MKLVIVIISYSFMAEENCVLPSIIKCILADIILHTLIFLVRMFCSQIIMSVQRKLYKLKFSNMLRLTKVSYFGL
jgi:hypothetical protein